jgi:hypothetical protein
MKNRYDVTLAVSYEEAAARVNDVDAAVVGFHFDNRRPDRYSGYCKRRASQAFVSAEFRAI